MRFSYSFSNSTLSSPSPSSLPPPPPPPSPNDPLSDIAPRKTSFSTMSASCAFPSWPNRSSLLNADSDSTVSSYLSDEDLFPTGTTSPQSEAAVDEEYVVDPVIGAPDLTTEEQIQMIRGAAEEDERRMRFLAHVHAHARAQQALRAAQLAAAERENAKRRKRRPVVEKKRRSTSSSSKTTATSERA